MMFGRESSSDLIQLLNLTSNSAQPLINLLANVNQVDVIERVVHRALQKRMRCVRRQVRIDQRIEPRIMKAMIGKRDQPAGRLADLLVESKQQRLVATDYDSFCIRRQLERTFE